jgi:hypothetical protein
MSSDGTALGFLGRIANHRKLPRQIALAGNLQYRTQQKNPLSFNDLQFFQGATNIEHQVDGLGAGGIS